MRLPDAVREGVEGALTRGAGSPQRVARVSAVGGGCISPTARLVTDTDEPYFLKWGGSDLPPGLLKAEARGLDALASADTVRVPGVVGSGGSGPDEWLLLEWLPPGGAQAGTWERLGVGLARLHQQRAERFGAPEENFIGSLHQANGLSDSWPDFWRDRRLAPQLEMARAAGLLTEGDERRFRSLFQELHDVLGVAAEEGPSLLHGDLWSGNVHIVKDGTPALVDPSVYHGHREVDLAMTELFGGFHQRFRAAYEKAWPLAPGYAPRRRAVYQLYYLLVHVNLFGAGYVSRTRQALSDAGVLER